MFYFGLTLLFLFNGALAESDIESFAHCDFEGTVEGTVLFYEYEGDPIIITGVVGGLPYGEDTNQLHGFHIHEFGSLNDSCKAAGSHFNPYNNQHGGPMDTDRHVGDLGNIDAQFGAAVVDIVDNLVTIRAEYEFSVLYRTIVIHAGEDDLGASGDPSGNAGARVACCIIKPGLPTYSLV